MMSALQPLRRLSASTAHRCQAPAKPKTPTSQTTGEQSSARARAVAGLWAAAAIVRLYFLPLQGSAAARALRGAWIMAASGQVELYMPCGLPLTLRRCQTRLPLPLR